MKYRRNLPHLSGEPFITDGGINTTLIFQHNIDIPLFASFVLVDTREGRLKLDAYYGEYLELARRFGRGLILDTPTWRANPDWGRKLGYDLDRLAGINAASVEMLTDLRAKSENRNPPIVVSGTIGPRGDGYKASIFSAEDAQDYHSHQVACFAESEADMIAAYTLTNVAEAVGIARAAAAFNMPCSISFTVETDGRLIDGTPLGDAITSVDAATGSSPVYYMVNCSHPIHISAGLDPTAPWANRLRGLRANASTETHAALDESGTLDAGDPVDLANRYRDIVRAMPAITVLGGCCGTDCTHIAAICEACG